MYLILTLIGLITYYFYVLIKGNRHWTKKKIIGPPPLPLLGNVLPVVLQQKSTGQLHTDIYRLYPEQRFVGFFTFVRPTLMVKRISDAEKVLIKDFSHFHDRGFPPDEESNPFGQNLFGLTGSRWRAVRKKLAPTFTLNKLKGMIDQMSECWDLLSTYLDAQSSSEIEMKDVTSLFAINVIASVAFGIDPKKLGDPNSEFRVMAKMFFNFNLKRMLNFTAVVNFPKFSRLLKLKAIPEDVTNYFAKIVKDTMEYRKNNNIHRNDFIQLMMQLKEKGNVDVTNWDAEDDYLISGDKLPTESVEITDNLLISQGIIFFTAGFETTANTIMFTLFEMTRKSAVLEKAREEVDFVIKNHKVFSYEALKDMVYLEQCIKETLRIHPAVFSLVRHCTKKYKFDEGGPLIEVNDQVVIPVFGIHTDPIYWNQPHDFDPERFAPGVVHPPGSYLPFGDGPRTCIAMRFAMLEMKLGLSKLLHLYNFKLNEKTEIPIRSNVRSFLNSPISPVYFNITRRASLSI